MRFENKVVIITGAASGIGAGTALLFAKEGALLTIVDIDGENLEVIAEKCEKTGHKPLTITADLRKDEDTKTIVKKTIAKYNKLDVLVNCAGKIAANKITDEDAMIVYDEIMNTNLRQIVFLMNLAAPHLIKTKGNIVSISSIAGTSQSPDFLAYSVSKAGLNHLTRCVAAQLAAHGVRVNAISPGPAATNILKGGDHNGTIEDFAAFTPLKKLVMPEEIGELVMYLASDMAKSVTGANYTIDNGYLLVR